MTPQPSPVVQNTAGAASLPMDGLGKSPAPTKSLGAFEAPAPAKVPAADGSTLTVKPSTDHVQVSLASGSVSAAKPVEIPKDVQWRQPVTAVQATGPQAKGAGEKAVITFVGDGDSVMAQKGDGSTLNCRIDSIDAPETAHPKYGKAGQRFGEEAKQTLEQLILNKEVTVRVSKPADAGKNYGRSLCQIEIEGQNIDKTMLKEGMAWLYRRFNSDPVLSNLENDARANKRGLWADPHPMNPEQFRRLQNYGR